MIPPMEIRQECNKEGIEPKICFEPEKHWPHEFFGKDEWEWAIYAGWSEE